MKYFINEATFESIEIEEREGNYAKWFAEEINTFIKEEKNKLYDSQVIKLNTNVMGSM
jgi:translation elongation factor P/translation initiation factor 5A